jgi:hypothetical protein
LQNNQENITKEWSELLPPAKLRNIGTVLSAEKLNDFLLTKQSNEYLDCFAGSSFYSQNTTRYFNLKASDLENKIPKEICFLADLYSGWNNEKMTEEQFLEAETKLRNFPAAALSKRVGNKNLLSLRKKLFDLKIHSKLMAILRRKYGLSQEIKSSRTTEEELDNLQIPRFCKT